MYFANSQIRRNIIGAIWIFSVFDYTIEKISEVKSDYIKSDFRDHDIKMLNPILKEVERLFSKDIVSCDYKVANERTYLVVHFSNLKKSSLFILKNHLKDKPFLLIEKENSIEIHIKNL